MLRRAWARFPKTTRTRPRRSDGGNKGSRDQGISKKSKRRRVKTGAGREAGRPRLRFGCWIEDRRRLSLCPDTPKCNIAGHGIVAGSVVRWFGVTGGGLPTPARGLAQESRVSPFTPPGFACSLSRPARPYGCREPTCRVRRGRRRRTAAPVRSRRANSPASQPPAQMTSCDTSLPAVISPA